jgi:uncharacterized membrane protein
VPGRGVDWTAFVLSFKGVLLEGLEVAFIVVSFGVTAQALPPAILGAAAAFLAVAGAGLLARGVVQRIPRSALQLLVGTLLSSFGTFWAAEGLGVAWPGGDTAILVLVGWYLLAAAGYIGWPAVPSGPGLGGGTAMPAMSTSATASENTQRGSRA